MNLFLKLKIKIARLEEGGNELCGVVKGLYGK